MSRVVKERQRVSRACDACKKKKIRCSGTQPCIRCVEWSLTCLYNASYNRGKPRARLPDGQGTSSSSSTITTTNTLSAENTPCSISTNPSSTLLPDHHHQLPPMTAPTSPSPPHPYSTRASPEPPHTDRQGQYVGSSSGVSFLLRVQKRLHLIDSPTTNSSFFPSASADSLPGTSSSSNPYDAASFILPPKTDAAELLDVYFGYAMPTYRFLHRPTVEGWLDEFYDSFEEGGGGGGEREKTAILLLIWAQAKKYSVLTKSQRPSDGGARYFHAAERHLAADTGPIRLTAVQARLCQCFYLLACSRLNHCRSLFGTIAHLVHALGLHRKPRKPLSSTSAPVDHIEQECRKRVFWCAYNMDKYLSAVLGRPSIFHDDDVDQELPAEVNDEDLRREGIVESAVRAQCIMVAPVLHARLGRILSGLLKELYSIHRTPMTRRAAIATHYTTLLHSWRSTLPPFLDPTKVDPSLLIPILQRQSRMLSLAYAHTVILINRPFLLRNFASLKWRKGADGGGGGEYEGNVKECLDAAMLVVGIVDDYSAGQQVFSAFWFTQYVAFCAIVILYVHTIQHTPTNPTYFSAANNCQDQLMTAAKDNSLATRYRIVLEELKAEAGQRVAEQQLEEPVKGYDDVWRDETSPNSIMADLTSWEEFDYLVMDCMGGSGMVEAGAGAGAGFADVEAGMGLM